MSMIWGPRPALLAAAMLRRSQVCSALQPCGLWSGASRHGCAALGQERAFGPKKSRNF